jgi:hypothetical protein
MVTRLDALAAAAHGDKAQQLTATGDNLVAQATA